jgi:pimeloyl-ACP methyl ester carboxylesterase
LGQQSEIDLGYMKITGKYWGTKSGEPTIALHGYLDNANSFDMVAPHLNGLCIFSMDFAGHGWSDHRREGELYTGLNDIRDVLAVADTLGWQTFNILGHSMGAEIGSQIAGFFPDRVNRLICIDGYCGTNNAIETMGHIQSSIASSFKKKSNLKVFKDFAAMTKRLREATGQNEASATCLIERGHKSVPGGYTWRTDPRIQGSGPLELTTEQLVVLLDNTVADTLLIVADMQNEWLRHTLDVLEARGDKNLNMVSLPGPHHLHMEDEAAAVAVLINDFIRSSLKKIA